MFPMLRLLPFLVGPDLVEIGKLVVSTVAQPKRSHHQRRRKARVARMRHRNRYKAR